MGTVIKGISVAVPKKILTNDDLKTKYNYDKIDKISKSSGIYKRRVVDEGQGPIELIEVAIRKLLNKLNINISEIDGLILITQTPEYSLPSTACILQNKLKMKEEVIAFDINLGCSGYPYGLILANSLLKSKTIKKILLIVGDITSSTASPEDITTTPLFGDAYSATLLEEKDDEDDILSFDFGTDGSGWNSLIKPVGGYRFPSVDDFNNLREKPLGLEQIKYPDFTYMDGNEIFSFCLKKIPITIKNNLTKANLSEEDFEYYIFHQANLFMIKHIANKLKIPLSKIPLSLENFGNTSGASIPLTLCYYFRNKIVKNPIMLIGFGVGFSWASVSLKIDKVILVDIIEV